MKLIDLIEILTKLEKTDLNRYADIVVMVDDEIVDLADASIGFVDNSNDKVLVLYTESNDDTH